MHKLALVNTDFTEYLAKIGYDYIYEDINSKYSLIYCTSLHEMFAYEWLSHNIMFNGDIISINIPIKIDTLVECVQKFGGNINPDRHQMRYIVEALSDYIAYCL